MSFFLFLGDLIGDGSGGLINAVLWEDGVVILWEDDNYIQWG